MAETHARKTRFPFHAWEVTETGFVPEQYRFTEAVMALANGYLGQRASFEEGVSGVESLRGNYIAGVFDYYPNPTMIKLKGRPSNPSQMVNIPDYLPIHIRLNGAEFDLSMCDIEAYARTLHMDTGVLTRDITCAVPGVGRVRITFLRFLSRSHKHLAAARVSVTPLDFSGTVEFISAIDGNVSNVTAQHIDEVTLLTELQAGTHGLVCRTKGTGITLALQAAEAVHGASPTLSSESTDRCSRQRFTVQCAAGDSVTFTKITAAATSRDLDVENDAITACTAFLAEGAALGVAGLLDAQQRCWAKIWRRVEIDVTDRSGSVELTQGLHYSLFQMIQNAPNDDYTVNIGAKGLTGEHYYGTYFWDTEVFMLPMFAFILPEVARDLVKSRAHMLPGARRKAEELGLHGAAYPWMSDADGNECCTLWQFSLLGMHITADVAWGVWFYFCTSGDLDFIADSGIDIMVETSRCWLSRVYFRPDLQQYVINRVLGPDEYHQGVDNNYYTNIMAQENLLKTCQLLEMLQAERPQAYAAAVQRLALTTEEVWQFHQVAEQIYLPRNAELGVNLQDDRFHLLEPYDLHANPLPAAIPVAWSYDRALRTQLLRQADVVVAHILLGDRFTQDEMRRDFAYYEPKTTHDSSLSFCSYAVMAARLGLTDMAYDYYLRTARLDIDDIHSNSWMGVHTACLAGAWQCVVLGFGGVRWYDGQLTLDPLLPAQWDAYTFSLCWHGATIKVIVRAGEVELCTDGAEVPLQLGAEEIVVSETAKIFMYSTSAVAATNGL